MTTALAYLTVALLAPYAAAWTVCCIVFSANVAVLSAVRLHIPPWRFLFKLAEGRLWWRFYWTGVATGLAMIAAAATLGPFKPWPVAVLVTAWVVLGALWPHLSARVEQVKQTARRGGAADG